MEAHIYSFYKCVNGNLKFKGIYLMKYHSSEIENGLVVFKDTEIKTAKANFLVDKNRVVKTGSTWKNSNLAKKLIAKNDFIKIRFYEEKISSNRTIDLINYLKKDKKYELYFIMGADNLINFHKWHKWKSIVKKCNLLVFDRQGYKAKSLKSVTYNGVNKKRLSFIKFKKVNISSSQLRKV